MKKTLKITGIFLLVMVLLIAGSAIYVGRFVEANKFKGKISQLVYAKTGQVLVINGDIHWSFFPWIGLKANNLDYYNAPGFTPKIFVSAKEMDIKVKLVPLATGKIEIGNITLNEATINLIKNKAGKYNWETTQQDKNPQPEDQNSNSQSAMSTLSIQSFGFKNGKLNWYDQQKNTHTFITALNINSKHIQFGRPFPLALQFDLLNDKDTPDLAFNLNTDMTVSSDYKSYSLQNLKMNGQYFSGQNKMDIKADGAIETDLQKQTLVTNLNFALNNVVGQLSLNGSDLKNKAHYEGTLSTEDFNLRNLLQEIGKPMDTKNSDALKSVSLLSKIEATDSSMRLTQLHAKIDKIDIFGNVTLLTKSKNVNFNLNANQIALDDYLSNKDDTAATQDKNAASDENKVADANSKWAVNGVIKVADVSVDKLKLSNLVANLDMRNDVIRVSPLTANLYKGQMEGSVTVDKHQQNKTAIYIKQSLKNINIKDLLHEVSDSDKLSGTTNITADLNSVTDTNTSFLSALNGKISFALTDGSLQGVDVIYQLSRAHSFVKHLPSPSLKDSKATEFKALTADGVVNNGVINIDNLALTSDYLKVDGKGSTNLVNKDISYRLNAKAQPRLAEENKDIGKDVTIYQVPIKISGKISKPSVNLDYAELAKNFLTKQLEKPIKQQIEKNIGNLKENIKEQVKDFSPSGLINKLTKSNSDKGSIPEVINGLTDSAE